MVSQYHYRLADPALESSPQSVGFPEWVRLTLGERDQHDYDSPRMFQPQTDWIADSSGEILVDFVGRFERFSQDFSTIYSKLGRRVDPPHLDPSKHEHYSRYYDEDAAEQVSRWFSKDIENFGYSFERRSSFVDAP